MRRALLILGLLTLAALWWGPLPQLARGAFFAHMMMHMGVVAVAAPLVALGIAGEWFDPVRKAPWLFAPIPASILELIVVWSWHAPGLHSAARQSTIGLVAEQGTFMFSGFILWLAAFGGDRPRDANRSGAGVIGLLLTSMHMTLLGALLALAPRPLYHAEGILARVRDLAALCLPPGLLTRGSATLEPLQDQHLGGAIMILVGGLSYLLGGLWLMRGLLIRPAESGEPG
jgi:putative membrane protein